jgi:threonine synthase
MRVTTLRCLKCDNFWPAEPTAYTCPTCGPGDEQVDPGILDVRYDYAGARAELLDGPHVGRTDIFRWLPLLPVTAPSAVLPAGGTPLVAAPQLAQRLGLAHLWLKDETRNPTRCLKDRATALFMTQALALGRRDVYCASAGNAAISLAGFAAHLGLACHVYVPNVVSATRLAWLERYGADVHVSQGDYDCAYDEAEEAGARQGWLSRNCAFNPYLVEGKKTVSFEIAEQLGWTAPDLVAAPVGDGCTLGAIGKGFRELREVGLVERMPRLLGAQAATLQPIVQRQCGETPHDNTGPTRAASIAVRAPRNALRLLRELDIGNGVMQAVTDAEIERAQTLLAREAGVVCEFTSAATLAGLMQLAEAESLAGQSVVLVLTGGRLDGDS